MAAKNSPKPNDRPVYLPRGPMAECPTKGGPSTTSFSYATLKKYIRAAPRRVAGRNDGNLRDWRARRFDYDNFIREVGAVADRGAGFAFSSTLAARYRVGRSQGPMDRGFSWNWQDLRLYPAYLEDSAPCLESTPAQSALTEAGVSYDSSGQSRGASTEPRQSDMRTPSHL